nr:hypothetical protein BaRGS_008120 [Batillaria attramentaria]
MLLMFTAFLSCAMMASVMPKELIDLVKSIPPQDEFLIYDIRGDLSTDDVLAAFTAFNVPYKFKTLSGRRFLIADSIRHAFSGAGRFGDAVFFFRFEITV